MNPAICCQWLCSVWLSGWKISSLGCNNLKSFTAVSKKTDLLHGVLFVCVCFYVWVCVYSHVTVYTPQLYIRHIHLTLTVSTLLTLTLTSSWVRGSFSVVRPNDSVCFLRFYTDASWWAHTHTLEKPHTFPWCKLKGGVVLTEGVLYPAASPSCRCWRVVINYA